jgi:PPK2 family polyphosphate:nucleotide phosphotransferase
MSNDRFLVKPGAKLRLKDHDPAWSGGKLAKQDADKLMQKNLKCLTEVQELLYASNKYALLIVLQAMDAAGKDGVIKHVMSGVNPQGCQVFAFKQPSNEELQHNYLWRYSKCLPERGKIGIFNRSYYEEVLVVRVHPELLERQKLARHKRGGELWRERYEDINHLEQHLTRNNTVILKFFLNISKEEQKRRFLKRLDTTDKHWKFSPADLAERAHWKEYMEAFEDALNATSTEHAPWYVIPADHKWVARSVISDILADTIQSLDLKIPELTKEQKAALADAKKVLAKE